jgi:hypothetical protein
VLSTPSPALLGKSPPLLIASPALLASSLALSSASPTLSSSHRHVQHLQHWWRHHLRFRQHLRSQGSTTDMFRVAWRHDNAAVSALQFCDEFIQLLASHMQCNMNIFQTTFMRAYSVMFVCRCLCFVFIRTGVSGPPIFVWHDKIAV